MLRYFCSARRSTSVFCLVFLHLLVQRLPKAVVSADARFEMFIVRTHGIPIGGFTVRRLAGSRELPIK